MLVFAVSCSCPVLGEQADFEERALEVEKSGEAGFRSVSSSRTGITVTNRLEGDPYLTHLVLHNGSGVAAGDVNGDGRCDVYFSCLQGPNRLYLNEGNWSFREAGKSAGVACAEQYSTGAVFADIDGDRDPDLLVNSVDQGSRLFLNDGSGRFRDAEDSGLKGKYGPTSMALGDIEGDGDLDLYVTNYRRRFYQDEPENLELTLAGEGGGMVVTEVNGEPVSKPRWKGRFTVEAGGNIVENGRPDFLYLNDGNGHFTSETVASGRFREVDGKPSPVLYDWGLAAMFHDLNGDRAPDLYVCNDNNSPDRIWINDGDGRFRAIDTLAIRHTSRSSMGLDIGDVNRDGHPDILSLDMLARGHVRRHTQLHRDLPPPGRVGRFRNRPRLPRNVLLLNRGDTTFTEIAHYSGLAASDWSWCPIFLDVDLDGYEDVLISNGFSLDLLDSDHQALIKKREREQQLTKRERQLLRRILPSFETKNAAFENRGDLTFEEVSREWGFDRKGVSNGMALADLDNDGDMDLVVNNLNDKAGVYENRVDSPRIAVSLQGRPPSTEGIGAQIELMGGPVPQSQEVIAGGRYLSDDQTRSVFAVGNRAKRLKIRVTWRNGEVAVIDGAKPNCHYIIRHTDESSDQRTASFDRGSHQHRADEEDRVGPLRNDAPYFEDVSDQLGHTHVETAFNDSARQPSIPRRLSQLGPGVAWYDFNSDGRQDLIIGSGKSGRLGAFRNLPNGTFKAMTGAPWNKNVTRDQTTPLGWTSRRGDVGLLVGSSNYEDGLPLGAPVKLYSEDRSAVDGIGSGRESGSGPLAMADFDQDGDLDLFVGGRVLPKKYPKAASSLLMRNENGNLQVDEVNSRRLKEVGMVSGAVWSDVEGDGDPDLLLACEWGSLRLFINEKGRLIDRTSEFGLAPWTGWWNGVETGDFNEDGRMDIVASNWGRNTPHEANRSKPLRLYHGDLNGDGVVEALEAHFDPERDAWVPYRDRLGAARAIPSIQERFATHRAYAKADIARILGEAMDEMAIRKANTLESSLFLHQGDHFVRKSLPTAAQFAPAFAVCVTDFDADGHEDVFLSQNFFATPPVTGRYDGGRGLWLRGNGQGELFAVPGHISGVRVYGEQRGAAVADYDRDGRVDLVVAQNGAETRLFRNAIDTRGIRARLKGPDGNPYAIGAQMRLIYPNSKGPVRAVEAGSGYCSQNSAVQVLGMKADPESLWVRWPDGNETVTELPPGVQEVTVTSSGDCK